MRNRQLALLFIGSYVPPFVGMGLFPILPLYAARFGATHTMVGMYYAIVYLTSLLSVMAAGWLGPGSSGAFMLIIASRLWHYQLAATLLFVAWCTNSSVSSALAATELPPEVLSRGLPRLRVMDRAASIVGFAAAGYLADALGRAGTYGLVMVLAAVALPLWGAPLSGRWLRRVHLGRPVRAQM